MNEFWHGTRPGHAERGHHRPVRPRTGAATAFSPTSSSSSVAAQTVGAVIINDYRVAWRDGSWLLRSMYGARSTVWAGRAADGTPGRLNEYGGPSACIRRAGVGATPTGRPGLRLFIPNEPWFQVPAQQAGC